MVNNTINFSNFQIDQYGKSNITNLGCTEWCTKQLNYAISQINHTGHILIFIAVLVLLYNFIIINYNEIITEKLDISEEKQAKTIKYTNEFAMYLLIFYLIYSLFFI